MVPIDLEGAVRSLELMAGRRTSMHGGACARDLDCPDVEQLEQTGKGVLLSTHVINFKARTVTVYDAGYQGILSEIVPEEYNFEI